MLYIRARLGKQLRRQATLTLEVARQVTLVGKAHFEGDFSQGQATGQEQAFGRCHPLGDDVLVQ